MTCTEYTVHIEPFAERHFIKSFEKKHKRAWDLTRAALLREFQSFDIILERSIAEAITARDAALVLCKTEFKVAGTCESRHASGNRCIVAVHADNRLVRVLLVYHKNDLGKGPETVAWKKMVKENYPQYSSLL
jgi:hypothetical protein